MPLKHRILNKNFLCKACSLALSTLFLTACAQKYDTLPNTRVVPACQTPIITYTFGTVRHGDYNDLNFSNSKMHKYIQEALDQSGCFAHTLEVTNASTHYRLDAAYGNINTKSRTGGFWHTQTSDSLIIEVQLAFHRMDETRVFQGKSSLQNANEQYLKFFGEKSTINDTEIQIILKNAINSATNEATRSFLLEGRNNSER